MSRQARGYDAAYVRERASLVGQPCQMRLPGCTGIATTADHVHGRTTSRLLRPACGHCNYAAGAATARASA